ncbi:hypothetical protein [Haladaptatus halobius]|uniref:hypothetical protein n=1 Tax=Haladaptatus halobius TaxID=2884875 RepID=UPI001D0A02B0|nr:hypothetical protein [Haladaptatus halobius]
MADAIFDIPDESRLALFWRTAIVFVVIVLIWLVVGEGLGSLFGPAYADRVGHAVRAVVIISHRLEG